jgi:hypothetical protein
MLIVDVTNYAPEENQIESGAVAPHSQNVAVISGAPFRALRFGVRRCSGAFDSASRPKLGSS